MTTGKASKSRRKLALTNLAVSFGSQVLIIILNFVSRTFFLHFLSSEYLGINGLFTNILTVLSLAELGIGEAMVFAMYKPMSEGNTQQLSKLLNFYRQAYRCIAVSVAAVGFVLSFFLEHLVESVPDIDENFQIIFLLYLANTVASYLLTYNRSLLLADQKRFIVIIIQTIFSVLQIIIQIFLLWLFKDFFLYLVVQILCLIMGNVVISLYVNKHYKSITSNKKLRLAKEERSGIFSNIKSLAVTRIAGVIGTGTDNLIISKMIGLTTVGLVSNYTLIINAVNGLLWSALNGLVNSIGNFNVDSSIERRRSVFDQIYLCSYAVFTFSGVCIVSLVNPFIELWLGSDFVMDFSIPFTLVLSIFIGGINFAAYSFRVSLGYFKEVQWFYVGYAVLNIILSVIAGKLWGAAGIFLATSVSRLLTAEIADGYYIYKYALNRNPIFYYLKDIFSIATFGAICLLISFLNSLVPGVGIGSFAIKCILTVFVTLSLLLLFSFRQKGFSELCSYVKNILKRK